MHFAFYTVRDSLTKQPSCPEYNVLSAGSHRMKLMIQPLPSPGPADTVKESAALTAHFPSHLIDMLIKAG